MSSAFVMAEEPLDPWEGPSAMRVRHHDTPLVPDDDQDDESSRFDLAATSAEEPAENSHFRDAWDPATPATGPPAWQPALAGPLFDWSKYPTAALTGFFQADAAWFNQDEANRRAVGDVPNGADFRRARLAAKGDAWDNVGYMLEMDFAFPGRPSFMDVYLDIRDVPHLGTVRIGQFRQPFGMDSMTSVRELWFLERALPFAFVPFRQIGVGFFDHSEDERATWALSAFRFPTDVFGTNVGDSGGYGLAGRATYLPWYDEQRHELLHVGFDYSLGDPSNDVVRYRNQPELFVGETGGSNIGAVPGNVPFFVDTGVVPTDMFNLFGVEFGAQRGPAHAQAEVFWAVVDPVGGDQVAFPGAYAQLGYVLTGESHDYSTTQGVFQRVEPHQSVGRAGGIGAWEIVGRWSYIDLNDAPVQGGRLTDLTAGLNWYLNPFTKFQFNYIHAFLGERTQGDSNADIVAVRAQLDF
ncbi:MAG: porin [Planctomycetales bacterium]